MVNRLSERVTCKICGIKLASQKFLDRHCKTKHKKWKWGLPNTILQWSSYIILMTWAIITLKENQFCRLGIFLSCLCIHRDNTEQFQYDISNKICLLHVDLLHRPPPFVSTGFVVSTILPSHFYTDYIALYILHSDHPIWLQLIVCHKNHMIFVNSQRVSLSLIAYAIPFESC